MSYVFTPSLTNPSITLPSEIIKDTLKENLGNLSLLSFHFILNIFKQLRPIDFYHTRILNKGIYLLSCRFLQMQFIENILPSIHLIFSRIDWINAYEQEILNEINFNNLRKRTCSVISYSFPRLERTNRLIRRVVVTPKLIDYFFSFDKNGYLRAISQNRYPSRFFDVEGIIQELKPSDWNLHSSIHCQFIICALLDGHYTFIPSLKFEIITPINEKQSYAIRNLKHKVNEWFKDMLTSPYLDQYVEQSIGTQYPYPCKSIRLIRKANKYFTNEHKAYFIFFRQLLETPMSLI